MPKRTIAPKNPSVGTSMSASKTAPKKKTTPGKGNGSALYKKANNIVGKEIESGVNDLRKERRQVRRETKNQMTRANALYDRSVGDLDAVYGQTSGFIGAQNQKIATQYDANRNQSVAANAALAAQLAANSATNASGANAEMQRLGIAGSGSMDQFAADSTFTQGVASQTAANDMSNINLAASNSSSVGSLLSGMNQAALITGRGRALNARSDAHFEAEQSRRDGYNQVREAMSDVRGQRKDLVRELMMQLRQSGWGKHAETLAATSSSSGTSTSSSASPVGTGSNSPTGRPAPTSYYDAKADAQTNALTQGYIPPKKSKRKTLPKSNRSFTY